MSEEGDVRDRFLVDPTGKCQQAAHGRTRSAEWMVKVTVVLWVRMPVEAPQPLFFGDPIDTGVPLTREGAAAGSFIFFGFLASRLPRIWPLAMLISQVALNALPAKRKGPRPQERRGARRRRAPQIVLRPHPVRQYIRGRPFGRWRHRWVPDSGATNVERSAHSAWSLSAVILPFRWSATSSKPTF